MRRFLIAILLLILLGVGMFFAEQWNFLAPGPNTPKGNVSVVWIKRGQGSGAVAQQLQDAGVVRDALLFRLGVRLRGENGALKAGEYAFPSRASMADVMGILIEGKSIQHKITVAEGLTSAMIYNIVQKDALLVGSPGAEPTEGSLLPETYLFVRGTARSQILARMGRAQQQFIAALWRTRTPDLPFTSPEQAVTLASIVEKETALPEERRHIAAVFINRLRSGMKLQSDPTVIYGITKGYPLGRGILESELTAATSYNTYVIPGLPPAPICNPGKDSIEAVLQPENSADLYFVANGTGGHVFTFSIAEHEKNVARWRQMEQAKTPSSPIATAPAVAPAPVPLRGTNQTTPPGKTVATRLVVHRHGRHRRAR
jgi:UPF0755 protein